MLGLDIRHAGRFNLCERYGRQDTPANANTIRRPATFHNRRYPCNLSI